MLNSEKKLINFLKANRNYNLELHQRVYQSILCGCRDKKSKITALLYHFANTQSQPKIDQLAETYKLIISDDKACSSFQAFCNKLNSKTISFKGLYSGLSEQKGFGPKTAALFTKAIYHFHSGRFKEFRIWNDVPPLTEEDVLYVPVDTVIFKVLKKINPKKSWTFKSANKYFQESGNDMNAEIWDDLWFWGYFNQIGSRKNRKFGWNENKYWAFRYSDKNPQTIKEIKTKSKRFLKIIKS